METKSDFSSDTKKMGREIEVLFLAKYLAVDYDEKEQIEIACNLLFRVAKNSGLKSEPFNMLLSSLMRIYSTTQKEE